MPQILPIENIRTDGGTQPRAVLDSNVVNEYRDLIQDGVKFRPVVVFHDGQNYWLAHGFLRLEAVRAADLDEIAAVVRPGTLEDAQWYSFGANKTNGLRLSNEDKKRAVVAALTHPRGAGRSDRGIAAHVGVDHKTVAACREEFSGEIPQMESRVATRNGREYQINTAKIGRRQQPAHTAREPEHLSAEDGVKSPAPGGSDAAQVQPRAKPPARAVASEQKHQEHTDAFAPIIADFLRNSERFVQLAQRLTRDKHFEVAQKQLEEGLAFIRARNNEMEQVLHLRTRSA